MKGLTWFRTGKKASMPSFSLRIVRWFLGLSTVSEGGFSLLQVSSRNLSIVIILGIDVGDPKKKIDWATYL